MKSTVLWALVVLNALLAVMFIARHTQDNAAYAQQAAAPAAAARRPGDYLLIPGDVSGASTGVVYILDTNNGWLGAMSYDDSSRQLGVMPRIDLTKVLTPEGPGGTGGQRRPAGGGYNR